MNPYAPPAADVSEVPPGRKTRRKGGNEEEPSFWREGDCVVMNKEGTSLPPRCVVCNAPIKGEVVLHQLMWHPPWMYALLLLGLIPYALFAVPSRKGARVKFGLCDAHQARRRSGLVLAWAGVGLALIVLGLAESHGSVPGVWLGLLLLAGLPITGVLLARVAPPARIDKRYLWLRVGAPFLASIPERQE